MNSHLPKDIGPAELIHALSCDSVAVQTLAATWLGEFGDDSQSAERHLLELLYEERRDKAPIELRFAIRTALRRIASGLPHVGAAGATAH